MKATFTTTLMLCTLPLLAQITIEQNTFPRPAGLTDLFYGGTTLGFNPPTEGTGQVWDYSDSEVTNVYSDTYIDATDDTDFPTALNKSFLFLNFQGMLSRSYIYESVDSDGWYDQGFVIMDTTHSIAAISGGANDVIHFPGQVQPYEGRLDYLPFPASYGVLWNPGHTEYIDFNLTVEAYGLNNVPAQRKRYVSQARSVVGEGSLRIPDMNGNPSGHLDALLIKVEASTMVDSFFVGGQPAPDALLAAFGLTQGDFTQFNDRYIFYVPGFVSNVANVNLNTFGSVSGFIYRPLAAELATSISEANAALRATYPNPIAAGDVLNMEFSNEARPASVELVDLAGRQVFARPVSDALGTARIGIPADLSPGMYSVILRDDRTYPIGNTKLIVR